MRTRVDWSPAPATGGLIRRRGAAPRAASAPSHAGAAPPPPLSLSSELRSRLGPRAEVRADLAIAQRVSVAHDAAAPASAGGLLGAFGGGGAGGGGGGGGGAGATTPLLLGLQAGTPASSRGPVVWRVGALQVRARAWVCVRVCVCVVAVGSYAGGTCSTGYARRSTTAVCRAVKGMVVVLELGCAPAGVGGPCRLRLTPACSCAVH
mgnify:CR=1 FL=1